MIDEIPVAQLLQNSPFYFIQKIWGFRVDNIHGKMLDHIINERRGLLLCPRGHGKSKLLQAYISYYILHNPNKRVILISDSDAKAQSFLRPIKTILENSPIIREFYGSVVGDRWTDHEITLAGRTEIHSEPSLMSLGAGSGAATGRHCDFLAVDDAESFHSARSEVQRNRLQEWYKTTILPVVMTGGKIVVCGTRYSNYDIYNMLLNELHYNSLILPAINKDGTALIPWLCPLNDKLDKKGNIIQEGLLSIRENLGSVIFAMQYNNDISLLNENSIIKADYIRYYNEITYIDNQLYINNNGKQVKIEKLFLSIDPAISLKNHADFTAMVVGGKGNDNNIYILDFINKHLTFNKQKEEIYRLNNKWSPNQVIVENVAYQASLIQELKRESGLNIVDIKPTTDKVARLMQVSGFFESGRVHFLKNQDIIINQLLTFSGDGKDKDDLVDSVVYLLNQMREGGSGLIVLRM